MQNSNPSEVVGLFARHQARLRGLVRCLMVAFVAIVAVVALLRLTSAQDGKRLDQAFSRADTNGDGQLSPEEISRFAALKDRTKGADRNLDGFVSFEEFRNQFADNLTTLKPSTGKLAVGDYLRVVKVADLERRYRVHVPKLYNQDKPTPVIVVFHGGGGNPESMIELTRINTKADEAGFLVVYPFGTGQLANSLLTFNGGECCGYAMQNKIDDVGFTRELLDDLAKVANVDADRVFATGLSNGGIMAHYVASELSDRIAAIAPVGGPLMMEIPRNKRPVPVMHIHGTADAFAPFQGGYGKGFLGRSKVTKFRSVDHTIQSWVKANGCNTEPEIVALPDVANDKMKVARKTWSGGKDGSEVVLIEIEGGGHTWPGQKPIVSLLGESTMDISANDMMWEFFQKHPRRSTEEGKPDSKQ